MIIKSRGENKRENEGDEIDNVVCIDVVENNKDDEDYNIDFLISE